MTRHKKPKIGPYRLTAAQYIIGQVHKRHAGRDCWVDWPFSSDEAGRPLVGYKIPETGVRVTNGAYRYAYYVKHGEWPLSACHRCPNHVFQEDKRCWNPLHVYSGTPAQNTADYCKHWPMREAIRGSDDWYSRWRTAAVVRTRPGSYRVAYMHRRTVLANSRYHATIAEIQRRFDERLAAERAARSCGLHGCAGDCSHSLGNLLVGPTVCVVQFGKKLVTFSSSPSGPLPNDVAELPDALDHLILRHG